MAITQALELAQRAGSPPHRWGTSLLVATHATGAAHPATWAGNLGRQPGPATWAGNLGKARAEDVAAGSGGPAPRREDERWSPPRRHQSLWAAAIMSCATQ